MCVVCCLMIRFIVSDAGKVKTTAVAKTLLVMLALFSGFLVREAYVFFNFGVYGYGGIVVGIIFIAGALGVAFVAVLPFLNVSSIKQLAAIQSGLDKAEASLTPQELNDLRAVIGVLEGVAAQRGVSLAGLINSMLVSNEGEQKKL